METNAQSMAKRLWNIVRVMLIMLRKGISKRKLLLDLNIIMKHGKIAGKALGNLMFHHHNNAASSGPQEYEFSCSNTPSYHLPSFLVASKRNKHHHANSSADVLSMANFEDNSYEDSCNFEALSSSMLPGFVYGQSPVVRQLMITDSPFPIQNDDGDEHVDEAAEEFIQRFYKQLQLQKKMD
ncbi:hypothetical protein Drorol1_Dr00013505 [Drosera rotundifolia]